MTSNKRCKAAVLTTGRQDYGVLRSTLHLLDNDTQFELLLLTGGMHLSARYGRTITQVMADGFIPAAQLDWLGDPFTEPDINVQMGSVTQLVGESLERLKPDFLMLVGDRYETAAAALAAVVTRVPIVHLHGGEETEGAFDNQLRHAITKMSHLHLVSHPLHASRVIQMGEAPETVHVVGAPGLDNLFRSDLLTRDELESRLKIKFSPPVIIITLHPVTTLEGETGQCVQALLAVMDQYPATYIITLPNADPGNALIRMEFTSWVEKHPNSRAVEALGEQAYFSLMREADLMAGNSSSGLIEAGAFLLPVIDIGNRQQGRLRGLNVIHSEPDAHLLLEVFRKGVSQEFRASLIGTTSPYGDGKSGQRILEVLKSGVLPKSTLKIFHQIDNSC